MFFSFDGAYAPPGVNDPVFTQENAFWFGKREEQMFFPVMIGGASRDSGNTNYTTVLRPGLLLGKVTATGKVKEWNPSGTDGSERLFGVLDLSVSMTRLGNNQDRFLGHVWVKGNVKPHRLLIPGQSDYGIYGNANEHTIKTQLYQMGSKLVDDTTANTGIAYPMPGGGWVDIVAKAANYTVTELDNNVFFTNRGASGAVTFTLPALPKKFLRFGFYVAADQTVTIAGAVDNQMIAFNDLDADSIAFSTSAEKLGTFVEIFGDGTNWLSIVHLPAETVTPTIDT